MHLFNCAQRLCITGLFLWAGCSIAQEYPVRVVRIVVADTAGSVGDNIMRYTAQRLTAVWGQQVIVDNRPGANQIIGTEHVARSKPDGYTLLSGTPSMLTMNQVVYKKLPYDSLRDFAPIAQITTNYFALVVNPALPATSVGALVKLAKSRPGEILYSSAGVGNQNHLSVEMFARAAGLKLMHVPHKGTAPAIVDLLGGQVAMMVTPIAGVAAHITSGKLRLLATAGSQRSPVFPDAPTLVESGFPDVVVIGWGGLLAPAGTPPDILNKVSRDIARSVTAADFRSALGIPGTELTPSTPEAFAAFIRTEIDKWSKIIRAVGLENSQ